MAKNKIVYFCQECGYESAKWVGQCPSCHAWASMVEEPVEKSAYNTGKSGGEKTPEPVGLSHVTLLEEDRMQTGIRELDRVLGGGIVQGSLVLVGGDPGIGKSTLLLQMCRQLADQGVSLLYISGEESLTQIKMRALRLGGFTRDVMILCETNLDAVEAVIRKHQPKVVIIDSIQTMYKEGVSSAPGSVSQVRESTGVLLMLAKGLGVSIFIVGHVTKEGVVAGPRVLEHMVDTVLYFEGDRHASYRLLRAVKNRFGSTNEIGVFEMRAEGLSEVENPSEYMLNGRPSGASGSVVSCAMEGTRPLLVEVQALVARTNFNMPRRTAAGFDYNRLNLLMAVLEKRLGLKLDSCDAYVNLAGGMRLSDPALDLAVVCALISSYQDRPVSARMMIFGEVGLTGEVRAVSQVQPRILEAAKLGFTSCLIPMVNLKSMEPVSGTCVIGVESVQDVLRYLDPAEGRKKSQA